MSSEGRAGVKVQLLGGSRLEREIGLKLSVSAQAGYGQSGEEKTSNTTTVSSSETVQTTDFSVNIGYRMTPYVLGYLNTFSTRDEISGTLSRNSVQMYKINTSSTSRGILAGINILTKKHFFVILEGGIAQTEVPNFDKRVSYPLGASIGGYW